MAASADGLRAAVERLPEGWAGRYFDVVDSTQASARDAARGGAAGRSVFVADFQRAGRGRQGRTWLAQPGVALLLSIVFRDAAFEPLRWTSLAAVALSEAIAAAAPGQQPAIKWPNDVLLGDRKVAGILAETFMDGSATVAVVGVGVNVGASPPNLAATSLRAAAGHDVDRAALLLAFVRRMDFWLARPTADVRAAWHALLWGRGQTVRLADLGRAEDVVVLGTDPDGALRVRLANGREHRTTTGELIL